MTTTYIPTHIRKIYLQLPSRLFLLPLLLCFCNLLWAQQTSITPANTYVPVTTAAFSSLTVTSSQTASINHFSNLGNVTNPTLTDAATYSWVIALGNVQRWVEVTDNNATGANVYPAGTYAGFVFTSSTLLDAISSTTVTVATTLNGSLTGNSYTSSMASLVKLLNNDQVRIGFITNQAYDGIRITFNISGLSALGSISVNYAELAKFNAGPVLSCNSHTAMNLPSYPMLVSSAITATTNLTSLLGGISNIDAVISSSSSDFATVDPSLGLLGDSITISVKDQLTDYAYPTFVGFDIESTTLASLSVAGNIVLKAYANGVLTGRATGGSLLVGASVLTGTNRQTIGFVPDGAVDSVCLTFKSGPILGVSLASTKIYSAVFRRFCEGPALDCNTLTGLDQTQYPVYINAQRTGVLGGLLAVNNHIENASSVIDGNNSTYATATVLAGALNVVGLSVKKELSDFPAGSFAGFEIANTSTLLTVDLLNDIAVVTYLDGVKKDSIYGSNALLSVSSSLLGGASNRQVVGLVATTAYDEAVIYFRNTVAANTGVTNIYHFYSQQFCSGTINCNGSYWLNSGPPPSGYPVIINSQRTGTTGLACATVTGVELNNVQNVISASTTDYATVKMGVNALCPVGISVEDILTTYPSGTIAGFAIRNMSSLVELDLFNDITIQTWNNGVLKESATAGSLLKLELLNSPIFGGGTGTYNVGFKTTMPFDEVRILLGALVTVDPLPEVRVYGAFVDTRNVTASDGSQALTCLVPSITPATPDPICEGSSVLLTANPAGATAYQWYKNEVEISGAVNQTYNASEAGSYTVIVDATGYSGVASNAVMVVVNPIPATPAISAAGPISFCNNGAVTLSSSAAAGNQWYKDAGLISGAINQDYIATEAGSYTVVVTVDGCSSAASNTIVVTVNDCMPIAVDDNYNVDEDNVLNNDVSQNDTPSGDGANTWSLVGTNGGASHGTVLMNPDGTFTYTPAANYFGSDAFTYQVCDPDNDCVSATVNITVNSVNDLPVAGTATATTQLNPVGTANATVAPSLFSGTDVDGTIQSLTITSFPDNATSITINGTTYTSVNFPGAGVVVPTNSTGQPTQTIAVDPIDGDISVVISYTVTDNEAATSANTGTVTIPFMQPPDLSPSITVAPSIMHGITSFYLTVQVTELNSVATNGTITVIIPRDTRVTFTYNPALTSVGFTSVNNSVWTYDGSNAFYHVFTTNNIIPAGGWSTFGVEAVFNPMNAQGSYTLTSTISSGSGGELRTNNNSDAEVVNYFPGN